MEKWILQCNYLQSSLARLNSYIYDQVTRLQLNLAGSISSRNFLTLAKQSAASSATTRLILSFSLSLFPSINQRGVLLSFHPRSDSHFLHFHPNGEVAKAGKRTARQRMLRGLIVSRAFERSDFTATVFSNDFPPLKASHPLSFLFHPPSLFLSLPLTSKVDGLLPPPTPRRCPPARILLRGRGGRGRRGATRSPRIVRESRGVVRQPSLMFLNYPRSLITGSFDVR